MVFHHLGIACEDIESQLLFIKSTQKVVDETEIVFDPNQDAYLCMVTLSDGSRLELVSGNAVKAFVKRRQTFYHVCYEVIDIQKQINIYAKEGALLVSPPKPAVLFNGKKVAFVMSMLGLIELLEK